MAIDLNQARDYVYGHGTLVERALFAWLFDAGPLERVQQTIRSYRNADGGYGHGFEHDLKAPASNPLALEYLLSLMKYAEIPPGDLLDGAANWLEARMDERGDLSNPPETRQYPLAPWWRDSGGQTMPDSIVGNLIRFGAATPSLIEKTRRWAMARHTLESIAANEWLFMAYHACDYFFAIDDFPDLPRFRQATIDNIIACATAAPDNQADSIFAFAPKPDSPIARALPPGLIDRALDYLEAAQEGDGRWLDQHSLPQWQPITTINVLLALRRYGRWS